MVHHGRPCHITFGNVFRHHCSVGDSLLLLGLRDRNLILWRWRAFEFLFSWRWWDSQHQFQAILYLSKDSRSLLAQVKVGDYPGVEEQLVNQMFRNFASWSQVLLRLVHFQDMKTRLFVGISLRCEVYRHRGRVKTLWWQGDHREGFHSHGGYPRPAGWSISGNISMGKSQH